MIGGKIMFNRSDHGSNGVVTSLFESPKDAHQHGLAVGPVLTSVAIAVFSEDHGQAKPIFTKLVIPEDPQSLLPPNIMNIPVASNFCRAAPCDKPSHAP